MLDINKALKVLNSYNISSNNYGASLYQDKENTGIVLDIKDRTFGFLTRCFTFDTELELDDFLKTYYSFKNNEKKYNLEISLSSYDTKNPTIKYYLEGNEISSDDLSNIDSKIEEKKEEILLTNLKNKYLKSIEDLTNYLINLLNQKESIKVKKNKLKEEENDLKYNLLIALTTYYEKEKNIPKKSVNKETINNVDNTLLINNLNNIKTKSLEEIKSYLKVLIESTKKEELDEKYLVNEYSNMIYTYNINILEKQITFVNNKINSEKKFSLKGTKIHNIDEELKSFLKSEPTPGNISTYLNNKKQELENKYSNISIDNISILTSNDNYIEPVETIYYKSTTIIDNLTNKYNSLPKNIQNTLILYNSFYKPICDYIIDNNYDTTNITNEFDFKYYYEELENILFNENNNHIRINYFNNINFKDINSYINSIIELTKEFDKTNITLVSDLKTFSPNNMNTYKTLTTTPIMDDSYIVTIPKNTEVKYVPFKLVINEEKEIDIKNTNNIYLKATIMKTDNILNLKIYNKKLKKKDKKSDILIATSLEETKNIKYIIGNLGDINE